MRWMLAVGAAAWALAHSGAAQAMIVTAVPEQPTPALATECEIWEGNAAENDGPAFVRLKLCPDGAGGVVGDLLYSSNPGGYSVRAVAGKWAGAKLDLHETRFLEYQPSPGWTHCLMDAYDLTKSSASAMGGRGASKACGDTDTKYTLRKVATRPAPTAKAAPAPATSPPPKAPAPPIRPLPRVRPSVKRPGRHEGPTGGPGSPSAR